MGSSPYSSRIGDKLADRAKWLSYRGPNGSFCAPLTHRAARQSGVRAWPVNIQAPPRPGPWPCRPFARWLAYGRNGNADSARLTSARDIPLWLRYLERLSQQRLNLWHNPGSW